MKKLLRVCIGITLVVTVGGFQYAQPFFLNSLSLPRKDVIRFHTRHVIYKNHRSARADSNY